jgi:predicted aminopeptidase
MTDLPDHVRMHLQAIWQRMDEENQAAAVALDKFVEERARVYATYPVSSHHEMYQKYAVPYVDEAAAHHAVVDRLWADYQAIMEFPWGQQEP